MSVIKRRETVGVKVGNVQVGGSAPKNAALSAISADSLGLVVTDTLIFNEGATIEADSITFAGGVLGGSGVFPFEILNSGTISPGDSAATPGIFTAAAGYTQTAQGVLHIELAGETDGEEHDELVVTGLATLGGILRLTVPRGYPYPVANTTYRIASADSMSGAFETIELQEGLNATVAYGETEVTATVIDFVPVSIEDSGPNELPTKLALHQNYPNPFNPTTTIRYDVPEATTVRIVVFDGLGRIVASLVNSYQPSGRHTVQWEAKGFPSGVYLARMKAGNFLETKALILTK